MSSRRGRPLGVALIVLLALIGVQAALAETPVIRFTKSDQALAKGAVLRLSDLGAGWTGGAKKPDLSDDTKCAGYNPKQSDLVLTGAAESQFTSQRIFITSSAHVLQTTRMVQVDWQRTAIHPSLWQCLREVMAREAGAKVVSVQPLSFPKLTPRTTRMRLVMDLSGANGSLRMLFDFVLIARGRTELTLMLAAPYAERAAADRAEARLAQLMVARTPA